MDPSNEVMRGLLAAAPDALLAVAADGGIVYVSDQAETLFGWARDDLLGADVEVLVPPRLRARHPTLRTAFMRQPSARSMGADLDLWACRRDGSEFPVEISLSSFTTSAGPFVSVAIRDVTVARRNEKRFRAVLASAPDAIVGVDVDGRIELLNERAERLFGWDAHELLGQQIEVLVPTELTARHVHHRSRFQAAPSARPMGAGLQLSARRRDGSTFPAEISLSAVEDAPGRAMTLAAIRDVTDRLEMEAERRRQVVERQRAQSHRLESIGQLAGGVAHDFNNLLGVILNYTTLLERSTTDEASIDDLRQIRGAAERAAALTRQLLSFARQERVDPEPLDINELIQDFSTLLVRTLGEHVELRLRLAPQSLVVVADRQQIEQVLLNVALNGRDAMPEGGALTIATAVGAADTDAGQDGTWVTITVTDTGEGMDAEVLSKVFEPFFTTKALGEGTGLGLSTVYGIVGQSGGRVAIASAPGRGTEVAIVLPLIDATAPDRATDEPTVVGGNERILLVEDERALRVVTERMLVAHGYRVVAAVDGLDALEIYRRAGGDFDLVVTDIAMPRMRGDELVAHLHEHDPDLRVVMMSGYDSGGADLPGHLLAKPVAEHVLLSTVRAVLEADASP